jgi:deazaflavin-dependent oxidoreductase (nitroreductase family)
MAKYVPSPRDWVREQVELYESSGGTEGTTLRDTGLPVIIVTHIGNKTGAIRKTPLMRVKDGNSYVLVGSQGGAPTDPVWVHNLRVNPDVEIRDETVVRPMRVREVEDEAERSRLWKLAIAAYPPYAEYQERTTRQIPVFIAERFGREHAHAGGATHQARLNGPGRPLCRCGSVGPRDGTTTRVLVALRRGTRRADRSGAI